MFYRISDPLRNIIYAVWRGVDDILADAIIWTIFESNTCLEMVISQKSSSEGIFKWCFFENWHIPPPPNFMYLYQGQYNEIRKSKQVLLSGIG